MQSLLLSNSVILFILKSPLTSTIQAKLSCFAIEYTSGKFYLKVETSKWKLVKIKGNLSFSYSFYVRLYVHKCPCVFVFLRAGMRCPSPRHVFV